MHEQYLLLLFLRNSPHHSLSFLTIYYNSNVPIEIFTARPVVFNSNALHRLPPLASFSQIQPPSWVSAAHNLPLEGTKKLAFLKAIFSQS